MIEKSTKVISIILFFGIILGFLGVSTFSEKKKFSDSENRPLAAAPEFSINGIFDRSYISGFESYVADHFPLRTNWIMAKSNVEKLIGKKEINGVYIFKDKLIGKFEQPDMNVVNNSIESIKNFSQKVDVPVFVMIVPTASGIYFNDLPNFAPETDQKAFIDNVYDKLSIGSEKITVIDAYSALYPTRDEYIYFRTDHHWTSLGAYNSYASAIRKLGFSPILYDKFDIEHASNKFYGTLYSKVLLNSIKPDSINFFHNYNADKVKSVIVDNGIEKKEYDDLYFREFLEENDKYSSFLGQNQPLVTINVDIKGGKKILVIKDSYAHSFAPFLAQHYSKITMVDLRYTMTSLDEIINIKEYDQILFMYNADTFSTDENIRKLVLVK